MRLSSFTVCKQLSNSGLGTFSALCRASNRLDNARIRSAPAEIGIQPGSNLIDSRVRVAAQQALDLAVEDDHLSRGGATALLGLAAWTAGDLDTAYRMYADGMARYEEGHFREALDAFERARLLSPTDDPRIREMIQRASAELTPTPTAVPPTVAPTEVPTLAPTAVDTPLPATALPASPTPQAQPAQAAPPARAQVAPPYDPKSLRVRA